LRRASCDSAAGFARAAVFFFDAGAALFFVVGDAFFFVAGFFATGQAGSRQKSLLPLRFSSIHAKKFRSRVAMSL